LGAVLDGCPAGVVWRQDLLERFLDRRRPGQNALQSQRQEADRVQVLSGVFEDKTLGTPIACVVHNQDARAKDYTAEHLQMRRGHATDLWQTKYGHSDPRGSGRASGRETLSRVIGGSIAKMFVEQLIPEVRVLAFTSQIANIQLSEDQLRSAFVTLHTDPWSVDQHSLRCPELQTNADMEVSVRTAQETGDSLGVTAFIYIEGLPGGLGQPVFGKLKNCLANAFMSIGATNGCEIGEGFQAARQSGKEFHNEQQDYGGLRGGLSTGHPLSVRVSFKPTSTLNAMAKQGRHDPCIIPRAIPVVEAMTWLVLAEQILLSRLDRI
jgi:chorismate synthase